MSVQSRKERLFVKKTKIKKVESRTRKFLQIELCFGEKWLETFVGSIYSFCSFLLTIYKTILEVSKLKK